VVLVRGLLERVAILEAENAVLKQENALLKAENLRIRQT
jgi:cell division protein FtsB